MATRCKFRGRRGILCDVLKINGSLVRNIDFNVTNFQVLRKTRRKTSILQLQSMKIAGSLARNARFGAPTYLENLESRVFPWPRRVYGGSCQTCPFVMLPTVKIRGSLVRNVRFSASTYLMSSRWFSCGIAVSMEEVQPFRFECVQAGCHIVLRGRRGNRGTLSHSNLFNNVSKISSLEKSRTKCSFFYTHVSCFESHMS